MRTVMTIALVGVSAVALLAMYAMATSDDAPAAQDRKIDNAVAEVVKTAIRLDAAALALLDALNALLCTQRLDARRRDAVMPLYRRMALYVSHLRLSVDNWATVVDEDLQHDIVYDAAVGQIGMFAHAIAADVRTVLDLVGDELPDDVVSKARRATGEGGVR